MTEPRFKPGDRVVVHHGGRGHVWTVVRKDTGPHHDPEPAYLLDDGRKIRFATESALEFAVGQEQSA